jgi:hypothetical protein
MDDSYVAGLIDADGSIIISKTIGTNKASVSPWYRLIVQVTNVYRPVLEMLEQEYGGWVLDKPLTIGSFFTRRLHYNWSIGSDPAVRLLERIKPHLIIKRSQAELAIEFWKKRTVSHGPTRLSANELNLREGFYLAMKNLNGTR